jgi:hypothetical protein
LRGELSRVFDLKDVTDLNYDVSFGYELRAKEDTRKAWTLRLSMVGPYSVLIRHSPPHPSAAIVNGPADATSADEQLIVRQSQSFGFDVLSRELLNIPVSLRLFATAPERVRVYQALFSDDDFLPGEYEADLHRQK